MNSCTKTLNLASFMIVPCGFNMVGAIPEVCPFCSASRDQFLLWDEAEKKYHVSEYAGNNNVSQLLSVPKLGYKHAASRIKTTKIAAWIDSPNGFNENESSDSS
jgi:hydroxyacylglutathione hydrolase